MGRIRKDALDLEFLPETCKVKFIGPKRISHFSSYFDKERKQVYCQDNSSQRYLDATKLNMPINCLEGFNPESDHCALPDGCLDFMRWISENDEIIRGLTIQSNSQQQIDFICTNMELKHIMLSKYEGYDKLIHAFRIRSEIFLYLGCVEETSDNVESKPEYNPEKTNKINYARFNVIRKITKRVQERELDSIADMDIFSTVSLSKIGQHRILHTGFTEFVMSKDDVDKPIDQANFAALKLMHNLYGGRVRRFNISFYRHLYWWASALVTGVETLICGDLDEDFTLRKLDVIPATVLNKKSKEKKNCLTTLDKILDFIKSEVKESNKVYDFHLDVETKEVIVSPSEIPVKAFDPPWCTSGDQRKFSHVNIK